MQVARLAAWSSARSMRPNRSTLARSHMHEKLRSRAMTMHRLPIASSGTKAIAFLVCAVAASLSCSPTRKDVPRSEPSSAAAEDSNETALAPQLYEVVTPSTRVDSAAAAGAEDRSRIVDSLVARNHSTVIYAAGMPGHQLELISNPDDAPDSADEIFAVLRDQRGRVEYAAESPVSQSGDWNIQSIHYFDTTGTTVVVERGASFFNGCTLANTDSTIGLRETVTSYFAPKHRLVKRTFVRTTFNDSTPAPKENCNESFRTAYSIYPNWDSLAVATGLGEMLRRTHH